MTGAIHGLVLAGGRSSRMGEEKGLIKYHGVAQYIYVMQLLRNYCSSVYLGCREEQVPLYPDVDIIQDAEAYAGHGPISGILSAFQHKSGPWLVVACDYPYIAQSDITHLLQQRKMEKKATAYINPETKIAEPLIAIYENNSARELQQNFMNGEYSLRRYLEESDTAWIAPHNLIALKSVDSEEEKRKVQIFFSH